MTKGFQNGIRFDVTIVVFKIFTNKVPFSQFRPKNTPKNLNEPINFVNKPQSAMQTYFLILLQVLNKDKPILASIAALN